MSTEITLHTNLDGEGRYTILLDGEPAGELDFRTDGERRTMIHTGVRDQFEGHGLGGQLVRRALDDARSEGLQVVPQCPYVAGYLEKHPEYQDLVAPTP